MSTGSVINKEVLPDVLSDAGFAYYLKKFLDGNIDVLNILVMHNMRLIYWYLESNIECEDNEYDDLFSLGIEALIESFYRFDLSRNVKFSTFATTCIKNKISKYFRSEKKHKKVISLDAPISDSVDADLFSDLICDDCVDIEEKFIEKDLDSYRKKLITKILDNLDGVDRSIIMLYFGFIDGRVYVQREISEILGISQSQVSKKLSATIKMIKNTIECIENENTVIRKISLHR